MEDRAARRWSHIARELTEAAFPLAGVPGFHSLLRTALVGTAGPGGAVLDVYCECAPDTAVARITVMWKKRRDDESFAFVELGRGCIAVTPSLDLRTDYGHFATASTWRTCPDGWQQIGPLDSAKIAEVKKALVLPKAVAAKAAPSEADAKCGCGHEQSLHDPCSKCECSRFHRPGRKVEKFARRR